MKQIPLSEVKNDLSKYLRLAEEEAIVITRHGKPAGILIGFESEDEWFEYRLEHHPEFLRDELQHDWELLQSGQPPVKIEPLR